MLESLLQEAVFVLLPSTATLLWLIAFAAVFALAGVLYARHARESLEDFVVARNSQSSTATILTLLASSLGAWILFSPAQAATWGGLAAVTGYAIGSMSPRLAMIPLGQRMRELIPEGHTLSEFVLSRYGKPMYALTLLIMLFYIFIALTAELTAMAKLVQLIAPIPLWVTAGIVLVSTLIYTSYGGLRASIFTDKVQMLIIVPALVILVAFGWQAIGGITPTVNALQQSAPQLLSFTDPMGIKAGLTFFVAILLTGLFHQGNWQRVYSAKDTRSMRRGFLLGGLLVAPFIFVMGLFGLAFMAFTPTGDSSVALFNVIMPVLPTWFVIVLIPLGLSLVMSSADTAISAIASIIAVDLQRLRPNTQAQTLRQLSRWLVIVLMVPVFIASAQGYSVLYLFLLADLLCSAAAFPVFYGLYSRKISGKTATISTLCGLVAGLVVFPAPGAAMDYLLESFLLAAMVPVGVTWLILKSISSNHQFDLDSLKFKIRGIDRSADLT
ncbi:sodium:solute symporter [Alcaligenaceae bacterium 429]|nr:sodium:solute symporter [Alcaligenaceae bacterium 429]